MPNRSSASTRCGSGAPESGIPSFIRCASEMLLCASRTSAIARPTHIQPVTSSRIANRPEFTALPGWDQFSSHSRRSMT